MTPVLLAIIGSIFVSPTFPREYIYDSTRRSWIDAQAFCDENHVGLATIITWTDLVNARNKSDEYDGFCWIGLNRLNDENDAWTWSDGTSCNITNGGHDCSDFWEPNEPNAGAEIEDCVELITHLIKETSTSVFNSAECHEQTGVLCNFDPDKTAAPSSTTTFQSTTYPTQNPNSMETMDPWWRTTEKENSSLQSTEKEISSLQSTEKENSSLQSTFTWATVIIIVCIILILFTSWAHATFIKKNDYFKIAAIITAGLQLLDTVSDCFFAVEISVKVHDYWIPLIVCIIFIVFPAFFSLFQLYHHLVKHWSTNNADDRLRGYFTKYSKQVLLMALIFGSSFTAISLLNSNMYNLKLFSMGLTQQQLKKFTTKRVYSVVIFENLPQLVLQIWYIFMIGQRTENLIAICSLVFSIISIIISVMSMFMERSLINSQQYVVISMDVTGTDVMTKADECRMRTKDIRKSICSLIGLDYDVTEILKPVNIANGLRLEMYVYVNVDEKEIDYNTSLNNNAGDEGQLSMLIQQHWELSNAPFISNIVIKTHKSKDQRKLTKDTKLIERNIVDEIYDDEKL